jgi:hypothetical protein
VPIIHIEEFETSLLTLLGVSLVLWRRKADNALSNPCFMALPLNFTTSAFPIPNYFTFKNFVRSRRDWKKKCREGSRHSPSYNRYGFANQLQLLVPFCIVMPTHGEGEGVGGGTLLGGKGGNRKHEMMMWGWWWNDLLFTFFLQRNFPRAWEEHILLSCFCFCFEIFALLLSFCRDIAFDFLHVLLWDEKQTEGKFWQAWRKNENLGASWNYLRQIFASDEKIGRVWKCLRPTFALDEKIGGVWKCLRPTFALDEKIGGVWKCLRQTFALDEKIGGVWKCLRQSFALGEKIGGVSKKEFENENDKIKKLKEKQTNDYRFQRSEKMK